MASNRLTPFPTTVHHFQSPTPHACAYEIGISDAKNALVFIGGLGDGPHTVFYPRAIAQHLEAQPELGYSVFEFRLKSSFMGFGFARLADDVADISSLVKYLRGIGKQKIVLMGHSTGSQDCMEYTSSSYDKEPVEGYILQAPASDRDALASETGVAQLDESVEVARKMIANGEGHQRMPLRHMPDSFKDTPISATRFYALAAKDGEDNYFSPDLSTETVRPYWSRIDKPLLILHSENDEFVPRTVEKGPLIKSWMSLCRPGIASELSGIIPGASHRVEEPGAEEWLAKTVVQFLQGI
ncbi:hypothetical protein F4778DRAFT_774588 [Xylariomycetidae sp. FL2044]|nr:hypothetical protein F4778DRAFT_774588 [Xylariomycetidae sp. FL2044]